MTKKESFTWNPEYGYKMLLGNLFWIQSENFLVIPSQIWWISPLTVLFILILIQSTNCISFKYHSFPFPLLLNFLLLWAIVLDFIERVILWHFTSFFLVMRLHTKKSYLMVSIFNCTTRREMVGKWVFNR